MWVSASNQRRARATSWKLWVLAVIVSTGVPVGLFAFMRKTATRELPPITAKKPLPIRVKVAPKAAPAAVVAKAEAPKPKPPELLPKNAQIVTVRAIEEEVPPKRTKYLANVDSTVKKEKKARPSPRKGAARPGVAAPSVSPVQAAESKSLEKTTAAAVQPEGQKALPEVEAPAKDGGVRNPDTEVSKDQGSRLLVPTLDRASAIANVQTLTGAGATADFLGDVEEEGEETVLNTRRFQHWDFFHEIQERVRQNWRAGDVYQRRDPSGKVFGVKDRLTVLRVTLDSSGKLAKLITVRDSGIDALDKEARRALTVAAPFDNPPKSLLGDDGRLTFQFSFMLELSSSRLRISRVPM